MPINRTMGPREWGLLLVLSVLWGGSFFFIGVALAGLPPLTLVLARVLLGSCVLFAVLRLTGGAVPRGWRVWRTLAAIALLNNVVPFTLLTWSQTQIASGLASILNATTPLWGVVAAHLFTVDEKATPGRLAGVALGFAGVVLMIGGDALAGMGGAVLAQGACLLATLCYALSGIYGRQMKVLGVAPISAACGQLACSTLVLLLPVMLVDTPWRLPMPSPAVWGALAGLVLLSTALAFVIYYRLLATAGATNLLLVTFLIPVTAIALGALFLGEVLQPRHAAGLAFLAGGLAAIDGRLPRRAWQRLRPGAR
ncbi:DMT family transporter [Croceibacterium ferulae]|uniref:DMT family transporter n=1 Tax=Croceibacterium ferulae TaxID=1854641 RepID=UPI000EAF2FEC|nr:EamA family transporter [Croceibacterium ferulae]